MVFRCTTCSAQSSHELKVCSVAMLFKMLGDAAALTWQTKRIEGLDSRWDTPTIVKWLLLAQGVPLKASPFLASGSGRHAFTLEGGHALQSSRRAYEAPS